MRSQFQDRNEFWAQSERPKKRGKSPAAWPRGMFPDRGMASRNVAKLEEILGKEVVDCAEFSLPSEFMPSLVLSKGNRLLIRNN